MADLQDRIDKLVAVVTKGVEMRKAQKIYFTQGRTRDQLDASKRAERDFDKAAAELDMPELF